MALDWPAFGEALWRVSDQTGIRPEWQLPVLSLETAGTFDPATINSIRCVGLNQFCPSVYSQYVPVPVDEYRRWSASRQLSGPILDFWRNAVGAYGPIRSATRLMLAQFGLPRINKPLGDVVFSGDSREYRANCHGCPDRPCGLDPTCKGFISVQDVANVLRFRTQTPEVREALARAYALRPGERPYDPIYGFDYGFAAPIETVNPPEVSGESALRVMASLAAIAAAGGVGVHVMRKSFRRRHGTA